MLPNNLNNKQTTKQSNQTTKKDNTMNFKQFNNNMAKANKLVEKIVSDKKELDNLLMQTTSLFNKGQEVTYMDKNNTQQKGKVLYCVGQKSLTVITSGNEKVNVSLDKLVIA